MSASRFEVAQGAIDGVNKTFSVSLPYAANTTAVFLNGKMYRRDWDDGWLETSPSLGVVDLKEAPIPGDVVQIFYTDTENFQTEAEVTNISGRLMEVGQLRGRLLEAELRLGYVYELEDLEGTLLDPLMVLGTVKDTEIFRAQLNEVCS